MFSYVLPIPEIINLYMVFFALLLDTDHEITSAFNGTKDVMSSLIKSAYAATGNKAYAKQPEALKDAGGPKGIAQGTSANYYSMNINNN